jgi:hypothetical protein
MQGLHSSFTANECDREERRYEAYQASCWIGNKDPLTKRNSEKLRVKILDKSREKLSKLQKKAKQYRCYVL